MAGRIIPPLLACALGVGTAVYTFQPLLESYSQSTGGTMRPEDDHHSAPVPPLPMTSLVPGKTAEGSDLPTTKGQEPPKLV